MCVKTAWPLIAAHSEGRPTINHTNLIAGWLYEAETGLKPRKTDFRWLCQEILKQQKPVTDGDIEAFWQKAARKNFEPIFLSFPARL